MKLIKTFALAIAFLPHIAHAKMIVITHPDNKLEPTLEQIRQLYLGKTKSLDGKMVLDPIDVPPGSPLRGKYLEQVVQKTQEQLNLYWSRLVFTGKASPPRKLTAQETVVDWVAQNKGALAIIDSQDLNPKVNQVFTFSD